MTTPLEPAAIVGLLAEPDRLRVVAALALGASTRGEVVAATGLSPRDVDRAVARLLTAGLVTRADDGLRLAVERLAQAAKSAAPEATGHDVPGVAADAARVLRGFIHDGRLTTIPASRSKRLIVLDWLAQEFVPGRRYPEREVNAVLARFHPDVAALRRYLVDEGLLARHGGEYWRTGGTFDVS